MSLHSVLSNITIIQTNYKSFLYKLLTIKLMINIFKIFLNSLPKTKIYKHLNNLKPYNLNNLEVKIVVITFSCIKEWLINVLLKYDSWILSVAFVLDVCQKYKGWRITNKCNCQKNVKKHKQQCLNKIDEIVLETEILTNKQSKNAGTQTYGEKQYFLKIFTNQISSKCN